MKRGRSGRTCCELTEAAGARRPDLALSGDFQLDPESATLMTELNGALLRTGTGDVGGLSIGTGWRGAKNGWGGAGRWNGSACGRSGVASRAGAFLPTLSMTFEMKVRVWSLRPG